MHTFQFDYLQFFSDLSSLPHLKAITPLPLPYSQLAKLSRAPINASLPKLKTLQLIVNCIDAPDSELPNLNVMYSLLIPFLGRIVPALEELTVHFEYTRYNRVHEDTEFETNFSKRLTETFSCLQKCQVFVENESFLNSSEFEPVHFQ